MAGTSFSQMRPIRPTPPTITAPVSSAVTQPTASRSQPKAASSAAAMELDCTRSPPPREARTQKKENSSAVPRLWRPCSMYSMGPPCHPPSGARRRYRMERSFSTHPVIIPRKADAHIQNTAPGPPKKIAVATPAMLPVPMVDARAVERAWIWLSPLPCSRRLRRKREPTVVRSHSPAPKSWKNPVRSERYSPSPRKPASSHGSQIRSPIHASQSMPSPPCFQGYARPRQIRTRPVRRQRETEAGRRSAARPWS